MDEGPKNDRQMIDDAAHRLGEHFESVQIFCSRTLPNGETESFARGVGNWNARWGQIEAWVRYVKTSESGFPKSSE